MKLHKRFSRPPKKWHYVVANGSSGYCYDKKSMNELIDYYKSEGLEVAVYRLLRVHRRA